MSIEKTVQQGVKAKQKPDVFSKSQIIAGLSGTYNPDLLQALLSDNQTYHKKEVEKLVNDYLQKEVN